MKKLFLTFTLIAAIVSTSLMSCSNAVNGSNQDVPLEELYAAFEKLGTFKEVGTVPTSYNRLYELDNVNPKVIEEFDKITDKNCLFGSLSYYLSNGNKIDADWSKYNYVELSVYSEAEKTLELRFIQKGATNNDTDDKWLGKAKYFTWQEFANIVGAPEPKSLSELLSCLDNNLGTIRRCAIVPKNFNRLYKYDAFTDKVTNFLKDKELNCLFQRGYYVSSNGKSIDLDYSKYSFAELNDLDVVNKTVEIRFVKKGTVREENSWIGTYVNLTWSDVINLSK